MPLATCPECLRHVKVGEVSCPFCEAALPADLSSRVQNRPIDSRRFGRAALVSFSAVLASSASACGSDDDSPDQIQQKQGPDGAGGSQASGGRSSGASGGSSGGDAGMGVGGQFAGTGGQFAGTGGQVGTPVYGAPIDPPWEPMPQPEYGVANDWDAEAPGPPDDAHRTDSGDGESNTGGCNGIVAVKPDGGEICNVPVPVYGIAVETDTQ
jgi:hypothetical protein